MDENQNPYESGPVSDLEDLHSRPNFPLPLYITVLIVGVAVILVASAIYNVSLWQGEERPSRNVAMNILRVEGFSVLFLLVFGFVQLVSAIVYLVLRETRQAAISIAGFVIGSVAILFVMIYDQALIYAQ